MLRKIWLAMRSREGVCNMSNNEDTEADGVKIVKVSIKAPSPIQETHELQTTRAQRTTETVPVVANGESKAVSTLSDIRLLRDAAAVFGGVLPVVSATSICYYQILVDLFDGTHLFPELAYMGVAGLLLAPILMLLAHTNWRYERAMIERVFDRDTRQEVTDITK